MKSWLHVIHVTSALPKEKLTPFTAPPSPLYIIIILSGGFSVEALNIGLLSTCVLTTPPGGYGGTEAAVTDLAVALAKQGHRVTVYGAEGSRRLMAEHVDDPDLIDVVEWCPLIEDWVGSEASVRVKEAEYVSFEEFKELISMHDVVNDHTWFKPGLKLRAEGKAACATCHGFHVELPDINVDKKCIIGVSKWHANYLSHTLNLKAEWAYNPVDISKYEVEKNKEDFILFLARISPEKGAMEFVEICRELGVKGVVAGSISVVSDKDYVRRVKELCEGSQGLVRFIGEVDFNGKVNLLKRAKALVIPLSLRYWEVFGIVFIEAMACGTPVITTDRGAPRELIIQSKTGYVCSDLEELKGVVARLMRGDLVFDSDDCRRRAEEFDRMNVVKRYVELYRRVLSGDAW